MLLIQTIHFQQVLIRKLLRYVCIRREELTLLATSFISKGPGVRTRDEYMADNVTGRSSILLTRMYYAGLVCLLSWPTQRSEFCRFHSNLITNVGCAANRQYNTEQCLTCVAS